MTTETPTSGSASVDPHRMIMRGRGESSIWSLPSSRRLCLEIALAATCLVAATWIRLLLNPMIGERLAFITYFPAVMLLTRWCTIWPLLLSCVGAAALADYWILAPRGISWDQLPMDVLQTGLFLVVSVWLVFTARIGQVARERAEARSRELEAMLMALPVGVAIARDPDCLSIEGNDVLRRLTGMERAANLTDGIAASTPPYRILQDGVEIPARDLPVRIAAREGRRTEAMPLDVVTRDGRLSHLMVSAVPLLDPVGRPHGAVGVMVDVTDQRTADHRFRRALHAGRMVAWSWDPVADTVTSSDMVDEVYGLLPGQSIKAANEGFALVHPDDRERHVALVQEALRTGTSYHSTFRIRRPIDGRVVWIDEYADIVKDPSGRMQLVGTVMDITALKSREDALAQSEATFRSLVEGASHIIWRSAADGRLTYVNGAWLRYTGQAAEAALAGWNAIIHPDDLDAVIRMHRQAVDDQRPWETEYRLRSADGTYRWWQGRSWPVLDATGSAMAWHGIAVDVHEQREAREALRHSEEFTRRIIESSGDCIKVLDLDGRLLSMNDGGLQAMEICDFRAVQNCKWVEFWEGAARLEAETALTAARNGGSGRFQGFCATAVGTPKWWDVVVTPILGNDNRPQRLLSTSRDITVSRSGMLALQEAEERFRYLAETMPQLVWMAGADGKLRWTNRHWTDFIGSNIHDAREAGWAVFHPDDTAEMFSSWRVAQDEKRSYQVEVRIRRGSDGAFRWFLVRAIPQLGSDSAVTGWIGTCTDVHDLKEAETAMRLAAERDRDREQQLRLALEAGAIGTWEFIPRTGEVIADARCRSLFGLADDRPVTHEAMLGCIHPVDRERVQDALQSATAVGGAGSYDVEYRVIGAEDGLLRYLKAKGRTSYDDEGAALRLHGTVVDLTDVRSADERDRLQAEAGALLVESFDIPQVLNGIADLCVRRIVDWCSFDVADEHGLLQRLAVSHRDRQRIELAHELHRRYPPAPDSPARQVFTTGKSFLLETVTDDLIVKGARDAEHLRLIRALGLRSIIVVPVKARDRILGVMTLVTAESRRTLVRADLEFVEELGRRIGIAIDNARLFAAEQAARAFAVDRAETLSQLNAELEQFAYVCSHDLQEPLRMIMQYLELTQMCIGQNLDDRSKRYMGYVTESAERMRMLILDLLGYARVGNAEAPQAQVVELERVLFEATENLRGAIAESGAVITHDPLPSIHGDKIQLVQVFQNLLSNAIKFRGDAAPRIAVSVSESPDQWIISVRDNGIGIPSEHRTKVFDVFQRLHPRERYPGSGIGLAVCRKIIARSGGRIWVEDAPVRGTVFRFSMPKSPMLISTIESARLSTSV